MFHLFKICLFSTQIFYRHIPRFEQQDLVMGAEHKITVIEEERTQTQMPRDQKFEETDQAVPAFVRT